MAEKNARLPLLRFVIDSNPFYLISACFMLAGCLALTNSLSGWSIPLPKLLILLATLNLYEAALIGLAAFLVLVRGLRRDGNVLVFVEAFFFIDITFLNAEISTQKGWIGPAIAAVSFLASIVKLAAIMRVLGIRRSPAQFAFVLFPIAAILVLPIVFSRTSTGVVSPLMFYIAWWIVGLMPALYELLVRCFKSEDQQPPRPALTAYMILPVISLIAHLGILHYVYNVPFYAPMAAPVLLALAMLLNHAAPTAFASRKQITALRLFLPLAAILLSSGSPTELTLFIDPHGHLTMTTLRLTSIAAFVELVYAFLRQYSIISLLAGLAYFLVVAYGPSVQQFHTSADDWWNKLTTLMTALTPTTASAWGSIFVVMAFAFLLLGAVVSLRRSSVHDAEIAQPNTDAS